MLLGLYITFPWYGMYLLVFTWINRALGLKRVAPKVGVFSCWDKLRFRGEGKKAIGFISKTTTLHAHQALLYISLPSLPDYNMKVPEFTFCRGREHKTTTFFSFPELWYSPLEFNSKNIWRSKRDGICAIKFEAVRIHFLSDVFVAVAVVVA